MILVGEMRDAETMKIALTLAETGHLVFSTLHTNSAAASITASSTSSRRTISARSACRSRRARGIVNQRLVEFRRRSVVCGGRGACSTGRVLDKIVNPDETQEQY